MTNLSRLQVYSATIATGFVPVFYNEDPNDASTFIEQCIQGGVQVFEFTNRGQAALPVFQHLRQQFPDIILGIGSIVDAPTAALYIAYGANFIVSPIFDQATAELCNTRKIAYMPGCGSVNEIQQAHRLGVEIIKLFPAHHYTPSYVKAIKAPMPWTRIMPTGGIAPTEQDIKQWFGAGVSCVGIGSQLSKADDVIATCQQVLNWISQYRIDDAHAL